MKLSLLAILFCSIVALKAEGVLAGPGVLSDAKVVDPLVAQVQQLVGSVPLPADLQNRLNDVVHTVGESVKACDPTSDDGCFGFKLVEAKKHV